MINQQINNQQAQLVNVQRPQHIQPPNGPLRLVPAQGIPQGQPVSIRIQGEPINITHAQLMNAQAPRPNAPQSSISQQQQPQQMQGQMMNMGQQQMRQPIQHQQNYGTNQQSQQGHGNNQPQQQHMRAGMTGNGQHQGPQQGQIRIQQQQQNQQMMNGPQAPQQRMQVQQNMQQNQQMRMQQGQQQHAAPMRMQNQQQQQQMRPQQQQSPMNQPQQQQVSQRPIMSNGGQEPMQMQQSMHRGDHHQQMQQGQSNMGRMTPQRMPNQMPNEQQRMQHGNPLNINRPSPQQPQMQQGHQNMNAPGPMQQQMRQQQPMQHQGSSQNPQGMNPNQQVPSHSSPVVRGQAQNSPQPPIRNIQSATSYQQSPQSQGQPMQHGRPQQQRQPQQMQMNRNVQQAPPHQQNVVADHQSQQQSQGQNVVHGSPQVIRIKGDHAIVDGMEFRIMPTSQGDDTNGQIQLVNAHPDAASGATQSIQLQRVDLPPGGLQKVTLQHRASSNQLIAPVSHNSPMGQMSQNQSSGLLNQQNQPQLQTQGMQNQQNPPPNSQQGPPQLAQPTPPPPRPKSTPRPRNRSKKIAPTADDLPQETDSQTMEQPNQGMTSGTPNGHMPNGSSQQTPKGRGRLNGPSNMPMGQQRPTNGMRNEQNFSPNPKMVQQGKHTVQVGGLPPDLQRAQFNTSQNQQQGGSSNRQPNGRMSFGRNQPSTSQPSTSQSKQPVQMTVIKDAIFSHVNGTAKMTPEYTEYVIGELTRVTHEMEKAGLDSDPRYASTRKLIALVKGEDPSKIETPKPRVRPDRPPLDDVKDALAEPVNETPEERKKRFDGYMELMKNAYPVQEYDIEFPPIDAETIRKEAANYMREDMKNRATYLKENIDKIPEEQRTKAKIEYLGLNLIDLQDKVRKDVEATLVFEPPIEFLANPWSIRRTKAEYALELKQHPDRAALEKKRRVTNNLLLHTLSKHTREFREFHKGLLAKHTKVRKAMQTQISNEAKRKTREEMKNEKLRIQKLISEDEDGYRAMLDDKKDQRLVYLLEQTDGYIESLTDLLKKQQNTGDGVAMRTVHKEFTGGEDGQKVRNILEKARTDEDEYVDKTKTNFEDYYSTAHGIREEIKQQHFTMGQGKEGLKLKPYQLKGLEWMVSLFNNNLNGILADEMGLGKTIQTIAFITYMMEIKKTSGPFLVIVPLSTISNWKNEFDKWAPHVQLLIYKGPKDSRKAIEPIIKSGKFNVLLTTFEYVIREKALLGKLRWKYMIIDEGHRLKNQHCKLTEMLNTRFQCQRRLLITGTPLQNKLPELWALLNFLLPSIFSSCSTFEQWFNAPFATTGEKVELTQEETMLIIRRLHKVLRPFLLRRLKKEVESELPDKTEFVIRCEMSALQKVLYKHMQKGLLLDGKINTGSRTLMNSMVHLRKLCNHPFLFRNVEESCRVFWNVNCVTGVDLYRVAGKLELLDRILPKLQACGHRVLMFFQMTSMMTVIEDYFAIRDINYLRLDGSTKPDERGLLLDKFNAPNSEYFLFMLSTRAGGLGLNLQTADTVIIFDSDWNPHQDMQAQDRAHRIGQKAEVRVFRLITANSVEEKILAAARYKLNVDEKVIQAGKFDNRSTGEERKQILEAIIRSENEAEEDDDIPNDEDINEMLSRSDEEFDLFQKMDQDRYAEEKQTKAKSRLVGDDELPTDILRAASETEYQEKAREEGREAYLEVIPGSRRKRKDVDYSADSMSDEKFLDKLFDGEDLAPERTEPREDFTGEKNITETSSETTGNSSLTFKVPRLVFKLGEEIKRKHKKSESDSDKDDTPTKKHRKHGESKKEKHSSEISTPIPKLKIKWPEDLNNTKDDESSKKKSHRGEGSSSMRDSDNEKTPKKRKHRESEHGGLSDGGSSEKKKKKKHRHKEREEFDSPAKNVERPADDSATTSAASVNSSNPLKIRFKIPDEFREAIGKSSDKKEKSDHKKRDRENETEEERKARKEAKKEKKRLQAAQEEETRIQEKLAKKARKEQRRLEKEKLAAATTETAETAETAGTADQQPTTSIPAPDPNPSTMKVTIIDSDEDEDNPLTWLQDEVTN